MDSVDTLLAFLMLLGEVVAVAMFVCLAIMVPACLFAVWRFRRWYRLNGQGDPYLGRLRDRNTRVGWAGVFVGGVILYTVFRYTFPDLLLGPLGYPVASLLIGIPLCLCLWGPIDDYFSIRGDSEEIKPNGNGPVV